MKNPFTPHHTRSTGATSPAEFTIRAGKTAKRTDVPLRDGRLSFSVKQTQLAGRRVGEGVEAGENLVVIVHEVV